MINYGSEKNIYYGKTKISDVTKKDISRLYASEIKLLHHTTKQIRKGKRSGKAVVLNDVHKITHICQRLLQS
jgi:hypothetical protein